MKREFINLAAGAAIFLGAVPAFGQQTRNLWIAQFTCEPKAAAAVASVQGSALDALRYSNLFGQVTSFASDSKQPAGSWSLQAKEIDYATGSAAERVMIGYGAGRAHVTMKYELLNPDGKIVWTKVIKTEPSFWGAAGPTGSIQNQRPAVSKQAQKLVDALSKFFAAKH